MNHLCEPCGVVQAAVTRMLIHTNAPLQNMNTPDTDLQFQLDYLTRKQTSMVELHRNTWASPTDNHLKNSPEGSENYRENSITPRT